MKIFAAGLALALSFAPTGAPAFAEEAPVAPGEALAGQSWPSAHGPHLEFAASYVHMQAAENALEGQFAGLWSPSTDHGLELGPRFGVLRAWGPAERTDFSVGEQNVLWVGSAGAPGVAIDWLTSTYGQGSDYRIEPFATLRLAHALREGALEVRVGLPYDSRFHWGFRLGVVLQLNGVQNPANRL